MFVRAGATCRSRFLPGKGPGQSDLAASFRTDRTGLVCTQVERPLAAPGAAFKELADDLAKQAVPLFDAVIAEDLVTGSVACGGL